MNNTSTLNKAAQFAAAKGFTHILAADGTKTHLGSLFGRRNHAAFQFVGGTGWLIHIHAKHGYYEVVCIVNGYTARYNPLYNRFIVSHDEIGAGLAEFATLEEFSDYAKKG